MKTILSENTAYWSNRAFSYSEVNKAELANGGRQRWSHCLHLEIVRHLPNRAPWNLCVLDIGTGPGFLRFFSASWVTM